MNFNSIARGLALAAAMSVAVSAAPVATASPATDTDAAVKIDEYMRSRMPHLRTPGVSLVVVHGDEVVLSRGYGFADREAGTPMTEDTPMPIASNNKGMTALAIMQLVE